jgi:hydroxyacid-oxoacid transhydrogenase
VYQDADLMDFVNVPIGKGRPVDRELRPLIAIPTTAGTGSETTGTAILDIPSRSFKTGISQRGMKPVLGIVVRLLYLFAMINILIHRLCVTPTGYSEHGILSDRSSDKCWT